LARLAIRRGTTRFSPRRTPQAASLVISLTSFPPRIERVHLVIQSLLTQTLQPHRIVLYLSQQEFPNRTLPQRLARLAQLAKDRFEIRFVEGNLGPYKKLLCALGDFSGSPIVTCDDDRIYPPQLLARLVRAAEQRPRTIICTCGRRMTARGNRLNSYREWPHDRAPERSFWLLPLGTWGVLYPPDSLDPAVHDTDLIQTLSPLTDDIWLKAMSLRQNVPCSATGGDQAIPELRFRDDAPLWRSNLLRHGNDVAITRVFSHFGLTVDAIQDMEQRLRNQLAGVS
jgi:hypothetical protein